MSLIVQKFGGTSVADTKKLFIVTERILEEYNKNSKIVVVVSAQGKLTDTLIKEELVITKTPLSREHDVLVSTGEQITVAKLSMLLQDLGYNAISYLGWQIPIITKNCFGNADILNIQTANIEKKLAEGKIVIVAGFQGINEKGEPTVGVFAQRTHTIIPIENCMIQTEISQDIAKTIINSLHGIIEADNVKKGHGAIIRIIL